MTHRKCLRFAVIFAAIPFLLAGCAKQQQAASGPTPEEIAARTQAEQAQKAAEALRTQLLDQFNHILEARDTPRGLVVNLGDVLFDTGKYSMRPEAREKLAKLSGIILAHPGLNLAVEGHTDNAGSEEANQKLSTNRAEAVRSYLIGHGLPENTVTAVGVGESNPAADNSTADGRKQNRRVEVIVSGDIIGVKVGA